MDVKDALPLGPRAALARDELARNQSFTQFQRVVETGSNKKSGEQLQVEKRRRNDLVPGVWKRDLYLLDFHHERAWAIDDPTQSLRTIRLLSEGLASQLIQPDYQGISPTVTGIPFTRVMMRNGRRLGQDAAAVGDLAWPQLDWGGSIPLPIVHYLQALEELLNIRPTTTPDVAAAGGGITVTMRPEEETEKNYPIDGWLMHMPIGSSDLFAASQAAVASAIVATHLGQRHSFQRWAILFEFWIANAVGEKRIQSLGQHWKPDMKNNPNRDAAGIKDLFSKLGDYKSGMVRNLQKTMEHELSLVPAAPDGEELSVEEWQQEEKERVARIQQDFRERTDLVNQRHALIIRFLQAAVDEDHWRSQDLREYMHLFGGAADNNVMVAWLRYWYLLWSNHPAWTQTRIMYTPDPDYSDTWNPPWWFERSWLFNPWETANFIYRFQHQDDIEKFGELVLSGEEQSLLGLLIQSRNTISDIGGMVVPARSLRELTEVGTMEPVETALSALRAQVDNLAALVSRYKEGKYKMDIADKKESAWRPMSKHLLEIHPGVKQLRLWTALPDAYYEKAVTPYLKLENKPGEQAAVARQRQSVRSQREYEEERSYGRGSGTKRGKESKQDQPSKMRQRMAPAGFPAPPFGDPDSVLRQLIQPGLVQSKSQATDPETLRKVSQGVGAFLARVKVFRD
jgi:hypothetical protein